MPLLRKTTKSIAFLAMALLAAPAFAQSLRAVPTYEAAGLYWSAPGAGAGAQGCEARFRVQGSTAWTPALNLWYDASANECRGSIVSLKPGTAYEAQANLPGSSATVGTTFATWSNSVPVAQTIKVPSGASTLNITAGGSASGYVVYDGTGSTIDAQNGSAYNITVNASYVVVRGFTLRGAQQHGIFISKDVHDVVIEDNDIAGWGRTRDGTWGTDMDSGIRAICVNQELTRVTVQRNRIHDPRYPANSWSDGHPAGPQGITFSYCGGNNVFRWNEIYSSANHFNDGMGGEDNFSTSGFPNRDSDVYGNRVEMTWDDGLEIEGGNNNVRVWGNYLNNTATGIASTITSIGPLYVFRNVYNRSRFYEKSSPDTDDRQPMFKSGSSSSFGNGRRYLLHNTMLQAVQSGLQYTLGGGAGIGGTGSTQLVNNTVSMNNIYHLWKPNGAFYQIGSGNTFQNDMTNAASTPEVGGIVATPVYASGNGWQSESGGMYQLAAGTPGYDQGARIANFNDGYLGAAPDVGAAEGGASAMRFGIAAASATPDTTGSGSSTPTTSTPGTGSGGTAPVSATMDSSSYTIAAGQPVTFTAALMGNNGSPTGTVAFKDGTSVIAGCSAIALSSGRAVCTTSALSSGAHPITGAYSGDGTYAAGTAGPITQTISGGTSTTPAPDIAVAQAANATGAAVGKDLVFTLTLSNVGGSAASGVSITDTLPAGATFVWASPVCARASSTVTCSIASIAAGASATVKIVVRPAASGTATNAASATTAGDAANGNDASSLAVAVAKASQATAVPRYRLYSPASSEHHFTTDVNEYNVLGASGLWVQEGTVGKVLNNPGSYNGIAATPYYRLYNTITHWHHWTTDANEYYTLSEYPGWNAEGIDGYILPNASAGTEQLYRLVYPNGSGLHHWTVDPNEYNSLIATYGWVGEGGSGFCIQ